MKRTLLVDTNRAAVPIFRALQDLGHQVWVVGADPEQPLAKLASNYTQLDYSDKSQLAAFVDKQGFNYLVPGCTDLSYRVCAEINQCRFPGLDTPETTNTINRKLAYRQLAGELGLPSPQVFTPQQAAEADAVVIKPVDAFSGRGMSVLQRPTADKLDQAMQHARQASSSNEVIIEEYITGQLYSHSAFFRDGKVIADFIVQEDCVVNPFTVDVSRVVDDYPLDMLNSIRRDISRLCCALKLRDGLLHTQFIRRADHYWLIESTRRCPGDIYALLIELTTGYPYAASYAAPFIDEYPAGQEKYDRFERITRHTVSSPNGTPLWGYQFFEPVDIRLFVPLAKSGDFIEPSPYGRAGVFFFHSPSIEDQEKLYRKLLDGSLYRFGCE
jgi:biotin carboxylase